VLLTVILAPAARGAITYAGDGTAGGLMPDFTQIWRPDQPQKALCAAAASTDLLWYLDQHGHAGLADQRDEDNPNASWRRDAKRLFDIVAKGLYGQAYVDGDTKAMKWNAGAVPEYIKAKKLYATERGDTGKLVLKVLNGSNANLDNWEYFVENGAVAGFISWRDEEDRRTSEWTHVITGGGVDSDEKKLIAVHGWDDHPQRFPPYKKPPYGRRETPYFMHMDFELNAKRQIRFPKSDNPDNEVILGRFEETDVVTLDKMAAFAKKKDANVSAKKTKTSEGKSQLSYSVENMSFAPIYTVATEMNVPFSLSEVQSPSGWNAMIWNPMLTPDMMLEPGLVAPPGYDNPEDVEWVAPFSGILWYTTDPAAAITGGLPLEGFSVTVDVFTPPRFGLLTAISDGLAGSLAGQAGNPDGLETEFDFVLEVPEPATVSMLAVGGLLLTMRRRASDA
jgi:hypothetical protein